MILKFYWRYSINLLPKHNLNLNFTIKVNYTIFMFLNLNLFLRNKNKKKKMYKIVKKIYISYKNIKNF